MYHLPLTNAEGLPIHVPDLIQAAYDALDLLQDIVEPGLENTEQAIAERADDVRAFLTEALQVDRPEPSTLARFTAVAPDRIEPYADERGGSSLTPGGVITTEEGATFEPWTNGWAVGFRCTNREGQVGYVYLNPSGGCDGGDPDAFLIAGHHGEPATDHSLSFVCPFDYLQD